MLVCFTKFVFPSIGLPDFQQAVSATAVQDKHCLKAQCQQITIAGLLKCRAHIYIASGDVFIAGPKNERIDAGSTASLKSTMGDT